MDAVLESGPQAEVWSQVKRAEKASAEHSKRERLVRDWLCARLKMTVDDSQPLWELIRDGSVLCRLLTHVDAVQFPERAQDSESAIQPLLIISNVDYFLRGIRKLGVPQYKMFDTTDLLNKERMPKVVSYVSLFVFFDIPSRRSIFLMVEMGWWVGTRWEGRGAVEWERFVERLKKQRCSRSKRDKKENMFEI